MERFTAKQPLTGDHKRFKLFASHNGGQAALAVDGGTDSGWSTEIPQRPGMFFQNEMNAEHEIAGLVLADHAVLSNSTVL